VNWFTLRLKKLSYVIAEAFSNCERDHQKALLRRMTMIKLFPVVAITCVLTLAGPAVQAPDPVLLIDRG
jgi:hypothetical protein